MNVDNLTPKQEEALKLLAKGQRSTLLVGGARSGKTYLIVRAIVHRALRAPNSRHAIFRFRYNSVRASVWLDTLPKVCRMAFGGLHYKDNRQDGFVEFENGSQIFFCGLDERERVEKILGMEFATLFFNEASQIPYLSYTVARTRLAQVCWDTQFDKPLAQREYVDLNPVGFSHWTYQQFIRKLNPISKTPLANPENYAHIFVNPLDNRQNLDPEMIATLEDLPEKQKKRFFSGEYVPDIEGALWPMDVIERCRVTQDDLPPMSRIIVSIDPSGTSGKDEEKRGDDIGICVAGKGLDGLCYILADRTVNASPLVWARIAIDAYKEFRADRIIAERNFGGAMVESLLRSVDPMVSYEEVVASRGKVQRAEPVAALYEKNRVKHVGRFPQLEEQLFSFATYGYLGERSPDRADACIWAVTHLMIDESFDLGVYIQAYGSREARKEFAEQQRLAELKGGAS